MKRTIHLTKPISKWHEEMYTKHTRKKRKLEKKAWYINHHKKKLEISFSAFVIHKVALESLKFVFES
jgi:hypothetical protein